jgi:hypothetical protein
MEANLTCAKEDQVMTDKWSRVLSAHPVNRQAAIAVSQTGCEDERGFLTRTELLHLLFRIRRKHRLLKRVLGITKRRQHNNMMRAFAERRPHYKVQSEPRAFAEYMRCGVEIARLSQELATDRKCRQLAAVYRNKVGGME